MAVGNGLMLREMAQVWDCPWTSEVLQVAARHLGAAALALLSFKRGAWMPLALKG